MLASNPEAEMAIVKSWAFGDLARKRQFEACANDHRTVLVKTVDLSRRGVGEQAHFDADSMIELGKRLAEGIRRVAAEK